MARSIPKPATDHQARWLHHRNFLGTISDEFADWMLTVAFYVAVHAVEALVANDNLPNHTSHEARNRTLKQTNRYAKVFRHFHPLYNASITTRYHASPADWVPVADVKTLISKNLYPLENSVQKLMSIDLKLQPIEWCSETSTTEATPSTTVK